MDDLLDEERLMRWSGYQQRARLEKWLRDCKIPYTRGQGGRICTTAGALNAALLGRAAEPARDIEFL